jgi:hypothetical protein
MFPAGTAEAFDKSALHGRDDSGKYDGDCCRQFGDNWEGCRGGDNDVRAEADQSGAQFEKALRVAIRESEVYDYILTLNPAVIF